MLYSHRSTVLHSYAAALPDSLNLSARDCIMPVVPLFHVNAWGACVRAWAACVGCVRTCMRGLRALVVGGWMRLNE